MRFPFAAVVSLALSGTARASVQVGADAAFAASYSSEMRAYGYAFVGSDDVEAGPFCHLRTTDGYSKDSLCGAALRVGRALHLDAGVAAVRHTYAYAGTKAASSGVGGILSLGLQLGAYAHLSLPFVYERFTSPNPPVRRGLEVVPMFGVNFGAKP